MSWPEKKLNFHGKIYGAYNVGSILGKVIILHTSFNYFKGEDDQLETFSLTTLPIENFEEFIDSNIQNPPS